MTLHPQIGSSFDEQVMQFDTVSDSSGWRNTTGRILAGVWFLWMAECNTCSCMPAASATTTLWTITWSLQVVIWLPLIVLLARRYCHNVPLTSSLELLACGNANTVTRYQRPRCKNAVAALLSTAVQHARRMTGNCTNHFAKHWRRCVRPATCHHSFRKINTKKSFDLGWRPAWGSRWLPRDDIRWFVALLELTEGVRREEPNMLSLLANHMLSILGIQKSSKVGVTAWRRSEQK